MNDSEQDTPVATPEAPAEQRRVVLTPRDKPQLFDRIDESSGMQCLEFGMTRIRGALETHFILKHLGKITTVKMRTADRPDSHQLWDFFYTIRAGVKGAKQVTPKFVIKLAKEIAKL